MLGRLAAVLAAAVAITSPSASATEWISTGPDNRWSIGSNWAGGIPPNGVTATAEFTNPGAPDGSSIDIVPWTLNAITFSGKSGWFVMDGPLSMGGSNPSITASLSATIYSLDLAADTTISAPAGSSLGVLVALTGPGGFIKEGDGNVTMNGVASTGPMIVNHGNITVTPTAGANALTIGTDGFVHTAAGASWGSLDGSGPIVSTGSITIGALGTDTTYTGNLVIPSGGGLTKAGSGSLTLAGTNTWSGQTTISGGTLQFGNGGAATIPTGPFANDGHLRFNIPPATPVTLGTMTGNGNLTIDSGNVSLSSWTTTGDATINYPGVLQPGVVSVGSLSGNGIIAISGLLAAGTNNADTTFTGSIGGGTFQKVGAGNMTLGGFLGSPDPVTIAVNGGTLTLAASVQAGSVSVNSGGTLRGSFPVQNMLSLSVGGTLELLATPPISAPILTLLGNIVVHIDGPAPSTGYGSARGTSLVSVNGANLTLTGAYVPVAGDVFTVLSNLSANPISGTMTGLPEGSVITFNGVPLVVSYAGTNGKSFTLTVPTRTVTPTTVLHGTIAPSTPQPVFPGTPATFTITPDAGYTASGVGGTCPAGSFAGTTYTTGNIVVDCTVLPIFTVITYSITSSGGPNGTITPPSQPVDYGNTAVFTVTPAANYVAMIGGTCPAGSFGGTTYTTGPIVGACNVTASFVLKKYDVTSTVGAGAGTGHGTITPALQQVEHGSTTTFTVTPDTGYTAAASGCGGTLAGTTFTTGTITGACVVTATFTLAQYTVTPSAGPNGTISPATPQLVNYLASAQFTVTADPGYAATVGGTCGGFMGGNTFTTGAITHDCTVTATFVPFVVYNVVLEGWQQVAPYVITSAIGSGTATYNPVAHTLKLNLTYAGLGSAETGAHLHGPAARGANAAILYPLAANSPKTDEITLFPTEETMLANGELYVNIHTANYPNGEIRGQIDNVGAVTRYNLFQSISGLGTGSVIGTTEAGTVIDCGSDCTESIPAGKTVTLTATATNGSIFRGWDRDCIASGSGPCTLTMSADKAPRAVFDPPATAQSADMSASQVTPATGATGRDLVITVTATNNGPAAATSAVAAYLLPPGADYVWSSPECVNLSGTVVCGIGALAASASASFKVVIRPTAAGALVSTSGGFADESDPDSSNNTSVVSVNVAASPPGAPILRYRLYSDVTKEHHFTTDLNEYNVLGTYVGTWVREGTVGKILNNPGPFGGVESTPYYRLYDNSTRWHHWTTDPNEYYTLGYVYAGWNLEGVDGWILPSQAPGTTQLYRLNYPALGSLHHWTIDANEYTTLINQFGWVGEPGAGFVVQ